MERAIIAIMLLSMASAELVFMDDFEYSVGRDDTNAVETFQANGWAYAKTEQDTSQNPGGYLYTVQAIPGYTGSFPGSSSNRVLAIESRPSQQEIIDGFLQQTDFYLQYGQESGQIGTIPPDVWFQFWLYNNDYGEEQSVFARSNKWLYPTRQSYPCTGDMCRWLVSIGTADSETDGSYGTDLGNGPDAYLTNRPPEAVFSGASEVPTNQDKLGSNLAPDTYIHANTWTLVKIHIDTSGSQGTYEMWLKKLGEDWVKTAEWIGSVTPEFTWPIPENLRDGHKMLRMPTTMNIRLDHGYGGDSWSYMDDFAIATEESDLPIYDAGGPYCGDTNCDSNEDCNTCPEDCGACQRPNLENECDNWNNDWIFCDDFESTGALVAEGRYFEMGTNNGEFDAYDGEGIAGSRGIRAHYQQGEVEAGALHLAFGRVPGSYFDQGIRNNEDFQEIYYRFYMKNDPNWQGNPAKVSRATVFARSDFSQAMIAHFWAGDSYNILMDPVNCVTGTTVRCSGYNDFNAMDWLGWGPGTTPLFNGNYNDQWLCIEHHVRLNDPGQANGIMEFWIDGNLEARHDDMNFVDRYTDYGLNAVYLETYWNSGSVRDQYRWYDNFVVSTRPIGCGDAPVCAHDADTDCADGVTLNELAMYIEQWKQGQHTIQEVMGAIVAWKG